MNIKTDPPLPVDHIVGPFGRRLYTVDHMHAYGALCAAAPWILVTPDALPDDDITVMLALSDGEVWQGYRNGEIWRDTSGMPIASARVTHWMHVPAHPEPVAKAAPIRTSTGFGCASCCAKQGEPHVAGCTEQGEPAPIESWHTGLPLPGAEGDAK